MNRANPSGVDRCDNFARASMPRCGSGPHCVVRSDRIARRGFSLVELLIVVSIMGIFAGIVLTSIDPGIQDKLQGAAQVVAADLAYARDLAVGGGSTYKISFDVKNERYVLEHTGSNAALDTLPDTPFRDPSDPADKQTTDLWSLGSDIDSVELYAVVDLTPSPETVTDLEFGPLGETSRSYETQIWLAAGQDDARRYVSISTNPVTGLASVGELQATAPSVAPDAEEVDAIDAVEDSGDSAPLLEGL